MGSEEEAAMNDETQQDVEDLEATDGDSVAGGLSEISGLKFEVDVIETKHSSRMP